MPTIPELIDNYENEIRELYESGLDVGTIAAQYGVSRFTMHKLMNRIGMERRQGGNNLADSEIIMPELFIQQKTKLDLTLKEIAQKSDVPYTTLYKYVTGQREMRLGVAIKTAKVLKIPMSDYFVKKANSEIHLWAALQGRVAEKERGYAYLKEIHDLYLETKQQKEEGE